MTQCDEWQNCYSPGWGDLLTPAAYSHPAKMSRSLVFKIIAHALEENWIQPGQWILDPFGGVGTTALPTLMAGLNYIGVELESRFVELGRQNIALWNGRFSGMPKWTGQAVLLQGDSRRLAEVVGAAGLVVSSPPYVDSMEKSGGIDPAKSTHIGGPHSQMNRSDTRYGETNGQLGAMKSGISPAPPLPCSPAIISSPPFAGNSGGRGEASRNPRGGPGAGAIDAALFDRHSGGMKKGTGDDPANLDHLPQGKPPTAIISSPPYADVVKGGEGPGARSPKWVEENCNDYDIAARDNAGKLVDYGSTDGQMGAMKAGNISAVIASPPFADSVGSDDPNKRGGLFRDEKRRNPQGGLAEPCDVNLTGTYGETEGQLGAMASTGHSVKAGAVIGSPPYAETTIRNDADYTEKEIAKAKADGKTATRATWGHNKGSSGQLNYGSTDGQIGATQGQTFWEAARLIVEQCALLLPVGGAAIWVVKRYVKDGKIVDFSQQWAQLCESCGFEIVHWHRAMLVKDNGEQETMADGHDTASSVTNLLGEETAKAGKPLTNKKNITAKKSFFRRLAEKNGSPPIDWEDVICTRKV